MRLRLLTLMVAISLCSPARAQDPPPEKVLVVVPLGRPSADLVAMVKETLERRMRVTVRVAEAMEMPAAAWYTPRKRWRAEKILDALDAKNWGDAWRVAAITEQPISTTKEEIEDWGIAGLGSLNGPSSVFSSYLFKRFAKKDRPFYLHAMENLVLHEVGHTLGLPHCPDDACIMADAKGNAVKAARASDNRFCARCRQRIHADLRDP